MLTDYLPAKAVSLNLVSTDKTSVILELIDLLCDVYGLTNKADIFAAILKREEMFSTGVGNGVAIPHAKMHGFATCKLVGGISSRGIEFDSIDDKPAKIFFLLVSPINGSGEHVKVLSELSRILNQAIAREELLSVETEKGFIDVLKKYQ